MLVLKNIAVVCFLSGGGMPSISILEAVHNQPNLDTFPSVYKVG